MSWRYEPDGAHVFVYLMYTFSYTQSWVSINLAGSWATSRSLYRRIIGIDQMPRSHGTKIIEWVFESSFLHSVWRRVAIAFVLPDVWSVKAYCTVVTIGLWCFFAWHHATDNNSYCCAAIIECVLAWCVIRICILYGYDHRLAMFHRFGRATDNTSSCCAAMVCIESHSRTLRLLMFEIHIWWLSVDDSSASQLRCSYHYNLGNIYLLSISDVSSASPICSAMQVRFHFLKWRSQRRERLAFRRVILILLFMKSHCYMHVDATPILEFSLSDFHVVVMSRSTSVARRKS